METPSIGPALAPEPAPLSAAEQKKLRDAAQEFESLLLNMLLKSMRATVPESTLFGESNELTMYEELRDERLADAMAQRSGLGLATAIEKQLAGNRSALSDLNRALDGARETGARARITAAVPSLLPKE